MHCYQLDKAPMPALTIRNVDETTKTALRVRAAEHGVSMEEEARRILREALARSAPVGGLGQKLALRFKGVAQADFTLPERHAQRVPPA